MEASVKIGDATLTATANQRAVDDQTHTLIMSDCYDGKVELRVVADEPAAVEVMAAFLLIEGPGGAFKALFPAFCP